MGSYYPILPQGYNRKPESNARLLANQYSPYYAGMVFDWVAGNTELFDSLGRASIRPSASRPARVATREGMVSRFVEDADERLVVNSPPLLDFLSPWTVAFRIWPADATATQYVCQIASTSGDPLQILLSVSSYDVVIGTDIPGLVVSSRSGLNSFPIEQWNNCVIVFNGDDKNSLSDYTYYINGVAYSANTGINIGVADNETWIGRATNTSGRDYGGDMAGIRVWRNRDLSPPLALELSRNWWAPRNHPMEYRADSLTWFFVPDGTGGEVINVSGVASIIAGASGDPEVARALTGTAAILASASGTAEVDRELSGVSDILIDGQGTLSTSGPTVINVSGSSYITMDAVGQLDVVREFAGQAEALVGASGQMDVDRQFAGLADILFSAQGTLTLLNLEAKGICIHRMGENRLMVRSPENRAMKPPGEERC